jgi:hypothetical protein
LPDEDTMHQLSRAIYRELAPLIREDGTHKTTEAREAVLQACEAATERLVTDRYYFKNPSRWLFQEVRAHFPIDHQAQAWNTISAYLRAITRWIDEHPEAATAGRHIQCRAFTRRGAPCQRPGLHRNGYCPSHQHLAETDELAAIAA